jgi:hypothetical protein
LRRQAAFVHTSAELEVLRPQLPDDAPLVAPRVGFIDGNSGAAGVGGRYPITLPKVVRTTPHAKRPM